MYEKTIVKPPGKSLIGQVSGNDRINRAKIYQQRGINLEQFPDQAKKEVKNQPVFGGFVQASQGQG